MSTQEYVQPSPLLGLAIGDALGKPFESIEGCPTPPKPSPDWNLQYLPGREEIVGEYGVPPGHFTDDTQMSLALANCLTSLGKWSRSEALLYYYAWRRGEGPYAPRGMGGTLRKALDYIAARGMAQASDDLNESGVRHRAHPCAPLDPVNDRYVGCGTAMRAAPIGAFFSNEEEILKVATEDAYLTHSSVEAAAGSFAVAMAVRFQIQTFGKNPASMLPSLRASLDRHFRYTRVAAAVDLVAALTHATPSAITLLRPDSDVASVVGSALAFFALVEAKEYALTAFRRAIHFGGDTDTRAAIVGALLGARWGKDVFTYDLVQGVERSAELMALDQLLVRRS